MKGVLMMSYQEISLKEIVKKQYHFKMKAFVELLNPLIFMQLIAILFSFNGIGQRGMGSMNGRLSVSYYSTDIVILLTILWAFIISIQLTTKNYREEIQAFIFHSKSSAMSDGLFLLTASTIGALFALGSRYIIIAINLYLFKEEKVLNVDITSSFSVIILGVLATIIIIFTFTMLGYLFGTAIQANKGLAYFIPAIFIGGFLSLLFLGDSIVIDWIHSIFTFYFFEDNFLLFAVKFLVTGLISFLLSLKLSERLEVS